MPSQSAFLAPKQGASRNLPVFLLLSDDSGKNAGHWEDAEHREDAERSPAAGHRSHGKHEGERCAGRAFFQACAECGQKVRWDRVRRKKGVFDAAIALHQRPAWRNHSSQSLRSACACLGRSHGCKETKMNRCFQSLGM